jgi:mono/diheme cytochrome c family protein
VLLALVWLAAGPAHAGGDPLAGRALARAKCAECHDIGETPEPGSVRSGPDWRRVAAARSRSRIRAFLVGKHQRMPRFVLSRQDIDDLVVYIAGLRPEAPQH